ncbi:hypothetical protein E2320_012356 [Naja naja]|nr:hypothetical protein E2320_012356 [Naja naja]
MYTQNLEKKKMIYLYRQQWPQYPLTDPEFLYYWDPEGETRPVPPAMEVKQFVSKEDESETEEWMGRPLASAPAAIQPPPLLIPLAPVPPPHSPSPPPAYPGLRRELAQLNKDLENLPLKCKWHKCTRKSSHSICGCSHKANRVERTKRTLPKLHENAMVAEQLELFLGPSEYTYSELIRKEFNQKQSWQLGIGDRLDKFPIADPNWDLNDAGHRELMRDMKRMILEGIKLANPQGKNLTKAFEVTQEKRSHQGISVPPPRKQPNTGSGTRNPCL